MNETETVIGAEVHPAKPSARQFYVWQAAMWITILHTALVGTTAAVLLGGGLGVPEYRYMVFPRSVDFSQIGGIAAFMYYPPSVPILACFMLVPIAIIACYRASMARRAWGWLLGYLLPATVICTLMLASSVLLARDKFIRNAVGAFVPWSVWSELAMQLFCRGLLILVIFMPPPHPC